MKVSVIMPVYNAELYLEQALDSVLKQTWPHIEIICINDGSTDNSANILNRYGNKIEVISQKNMGQCAASNKGLETATGDYIKFMDADDIINPEHIELQIKKLNSRTDAVASCEWGRFYNHDPKSANFIPENVWKDMSAFEWLKTSLSQKYDMMGAWLWLIPRPIIEKSGGWDVRLSLNNDFEFSVRLLLCAKDVLFAEGAKLFYRSGMNSSLASSYSYSAFNKAILSTDLGCSYLLNYDDSKEIRLICANRYQEWIYRMYPKHLDLIKKAKKKIKLLGGSNKKVDGGKIFKLLLFFFGWKLAKRIQLLFYHIGYTPKKRIQ